MAAGFGRLVLIVRGEILEAVENHIRRHWPGGSPSGVSSARTSNRRRWRQPPPGGRSPWGPPTPSSPPRPCLEGGPFGVANADDLYGASAFALLAEHLRQGGGHALVGYRLANTSSGTDR